MNPAALPVTFYDANLRATDTCYLDVADTNDVRLIVTGLRRLLAGSGHWTAAAQLADGIQLRVERA